MASASGSAQNTAPKTKARPNFLILITDEERYPTVYENEEIRRFRKEQLEGRNKILKHGVECTRHYSSSTACSPSRASLFTGHYPSFHRVSQTYGGAKEYNDERVFWLEDDSVPTMGDYFTEAGYDCIYKGKWHISFEDLVASDGHSPQTVGLNGVEKSIEKEYLDEDPLKKYGFSGWVGPEPHGTHQENSGMNMDPYYAQQVIDWLDERDKSDSDKPFLLCCSFVNPHDIVFFPVLWYWFQYRSPDSTIPHIPSSPTYWEDLRSKPSAQAKYISQYRKMFQPVFLPAAYRRLYYYLHKVVDAHVKRVYEKLAATRFFENTIVVFTSDHGDVLGSHGGMMQKWYNAYEECIHIPLVFSNPVLFKENQTKTLDFPTTHVDLIPTLLGLADIDADEINEKLKATHREAAKLVGHDFSKQLLGQSVSEPEVAVFFMTEDEVTRGNGQRGTPSKLFPVILKLYHWEFDHVDGSTSIEGIITTIQAENGKTEVWKYLRYWDNPENWSVPFVKNEFTHREFPLRGKKNTRTVPYPDEYEIYNLTKDPIEKTNLSNSSDAAILQVRRKLEQIFAQQKIQKRLKRSHPTSLTRAASLIIHGHYHGDIRLLISFWSILFSIPAFAITLSVFLARWLRKRIHG